jgi:pseudouridine synthase
MTFGDESNLGGARDAGSESEAGAAKVRLQRYMADAGVAARRVCEAMIAEGRVQVNGSTQRTLPVFVDPMMDRVTVDGRLVAKPQQAMTILVHKPQRVLVTSADEPGMDRATILDLVRLPAQARLFPVGRLGWDDAGLVVMTNDGELANTLTHPRFGVPKRYEVLVAGQVGEEELAKIRRSAKLIAKASAFEQRREQQREQGEGPLVRRSKARGDIEVVVLDREGGEAGKTVLGIAMGDAKGKPLRDILHGAGLPVRKLTRVAIGPLTLRGLKVGAWREVTREELRVLRAIAEDGRYDEQRAMKLMGKHETREGSKGGRGGAGPDEKFWPAPVLRQEAMKQQKLGQQRAARKPKTISDQLLAEREAGEREQRSTRDERAAGARGERRGAPDDGRARGSKPGLPRAGRPRFDDRGAGSLGAGSLGKGPRGSFAGRAAAEDGRGRGAKNASGGARGEKARGKPSAGAGFAGKPATRAQLPRATPQKGPARAASRGSGAEAGRGTPMEDGALIRRRPKPPSE